VITHFKNNVTKTRTVDPDQDLEARKRSTVNTMPVLFSKFFQLYKKKVCWWSGSALYPNSMTLWIRIEHNCWIRLRIKSIKIQKPAKNSAKAGRTYRILCSGWKFFPDTVVPI
jgi:hypothetical protein